MRVKPTNLDHNGQIVLEVVEGPFQGIQYYYTSMKMADHENEDGSMNMTFEYFLYECTVEDNKRLEFERFLGDALLEIVEDQMKRDALVFKGGTDENVISVDD